ncbi:MAG: ABC transporter ATP-binding protein [Burkholderiaceae bacterium]
MPGSNNQPQPVLSVRGLTRRFGGFLAVDGVDLEIEAGEIHALIGPNGAGKTTVFSMLSGFLQPSAGTIHFRGHDITRDGPARVAQMGMVRSFQISATFGRLSVHENVRVALQRKAGLTWQFWRAGSVLRRLDERADELLAEVNLTPFRDRLAETLGYGQKRLLELATTLAVDPQILLLDEPMAGIAHEEIEPVSELIRRSARTRTVLMVEHNLSVVRDLCSRISVLQRGEVISQGSYAQVSADPRVREAYIGTEV